MKRRSGKRILVVDDEERILQSLQGILEDEGFSVVVCQEGAVALDRLSEEEFDLVLLDIWMPGRDGLQILEQIRKKNLEIPVIMMSGHGTIETAVKATKLGAYDYIEKPLSIDKVLLVIQHAFNESDLQQQNRQLQADFRSRYEIVGKSRKMMAIKELIEKVAPTDSWILITGENGTGKEIVARNIHMKSRRATKPFVEVNCAAIPEELIESELFGHEKGAFTGAISKKRGKFDLAHGGTLFLDEIGDMSLKTQAKILRILQENRFERVGGTEPIEVDVRVIAATNKNLDEEIAQGKFREDLYYRLNVIPFHISPLRERKEDIPLFVEYFLNGIPSRGSRKTFSKEAMEQLVRYRWPGNVRELKNLIERVVILSSSDRIEAEEILPWLHPNVDGSSLEALSLEEAREKFEKEFIQRKLMENNGNISRTAEAIQISRENLSRKIKTLGIRIPRTSPSSNKRAQ